MTVNCDCEIVNCDCELVNCDRETVNCDCEPVNCDCESYSIDVCIIGQFQFLMIHQDINSNETKPK